MNDVSPIPLEFGEYRIDPRKRILRRGSGETIALTPKHFDTLLYLVENAGEVLEKERMMSAIWPGMIVEENNLNQAISQLRRVLGDNGAEHRYILTVPRRGYRFVAEVRRAVEPSDDPVHALPTAPVKEETSPPVITAVEPKPVAASRHAAAPPPASFRRGTILSVVLLAATALIVYAGYMWRFSPGEADDGNAKSIAVLPFVNLSANGGDDYFGDGITEDLVTQLAQISELKVISRTSIMQYKGSKKPLREIARELGVVHILQGSVRQSGSRFRINAQLIDPRRDGHVWAKSYDREVKDVLTVQGEVTGEIAAALKAKLLAPEREQLARYARGNPEAQRLFRAGYNLIGAHRERTEADLQQARAHFERIIEMDPASPLGYAGLAAFHIRTIAWGEATPGDAFTRAEALVAKALVADERSPEAHMILALIHGHGRWDWKQAEVAARRAVELSPGDANVWDTLRAAVLEPTGRLDEAEAAQRRALSLDPLNSAMAHRLAFLLVYQRRFDEALKQAQINLQVDPKYLNNYVVIARSHEAKGQYREAIAAYRVPNWSFFPDPALNEIEAALAKSGAEGYWRARLTWQQRYAAQQSEGVFYLAGFAAMIGGEEARNEAFRALNLAIDQRNRYLIYAKVETLFDPVRNDPRFAAAMKRLNLN